MDSYAKGDFGPAGGQEVADLVRLSMTLTLRPPGVVREVLPLPGTAVTACLAADAVSWRERTHAVAYYGAVADLERQALPHGGLTLFDEYCPDKTHSERG
jgi:hypothetical protein